MQTESEKLKDRLPHFYRTMHAAGAFDGVTFMPSLPELGELVGDPRPLSFIDYGCGPKGGLSQVFARVAPYDPYVPQYAAEPDWDRPVDVVFSSDVLEHMPASTVLEFLDRVMQNCPKYIFLVVALRHASKQLPNGLNAHITVEPAKWWQGLFQAVLHRHYDTDIARHDLKAETGTFGFRRKDVPARTREGSPCAYSPQPASPPASSSGPPNTASAVGESGPDSPPPSVSLP